VKYFLTSNLFLKNYKLIIFTTKLLQSKEWKKDMTNLRESLEDMLLNIQLVYELLLNPGNEIMSHEI